MTTTADGSTRDLHFRDVSSDGLGGAAITVLGAPKNGSDREIAAYAHNVTIEHCTLERTGKFMWDYGFLWQITVWPEDYDENLRTMARKYFRNDLVREALRIEANDDRVFLDNKTLLPVSVARWGAESERGYDSVCFFGKQLPKNIVRGRQYFVVDSQPEFLRISETVGGPPIRFSEAAGQDAKLITNLFQSHLALYAPRGVVPVREPSIWLGART